MHAFRFLLPLVLGGLLAGCGRLEEAVVVEDLRRAPEYFRESFLTFSGTPKFEGMGSYQWKSAGGGPTKVPGQRETHYRYVVPIVPKNWTPAEPVPLWVAFDSHRENISAEREALRKALGRGPISGRNVDNPERQPGLLRGVSAWQHAVVDAEQRHQVESHPTAPIVVWSRYFGSRDGSFRLAMEREDLV